MSITVISCPVLALTIGLGHCDIQGHSSLTLIYLYSHKVNFGVVRVGNSSPQLEVSHDVKWRSLDDALSNDAIIPGRKRRPIQAGVCMKQSV